MIEPQIHTLYELLESSMQIAFSISRMDDVSPEHQEVVDVLNELAQVILQKYKEENGYKDTVDAITEITDRLLNAG
jgi:hypothetical protein